MVWKVLCLFLCLLLADAAGGRKMPKLAERKLCADEECSHPISIAVALADYIPPDCRFIPIRRGQTLYIFSKLKGRGRLFWSGSVEGGEQEARLGYFPSSIVQEEHYLMPGKVEVKTDQWDFSCQ
ncbi:melanoma-derived growth regulatory protein [Pelodytes ibericus]